MKERDVIWLSIESSFHSDFCSSATESDLTDFIYYIFVVLIFFLIVSSIS